jgi:23S rRNA U2552 (ribose-2'-O)-methylase RlmE/FtsJ
MDEIPGVTIFKKDFYDEDAPAVLIAALGGAKADVVLSDMASATPRAPPDRSHQHHRAGGGGL